MKISIRRVFASRTRTSQVDQPLHLGIAESPAIDSERSDLLVGFQ